MFFPDEIKPIEETPVDVTDYLDDDGIPNFDGIEVHYADDISETDAASMLASLFGPGPDGVLTGG